MAQYLFQQKIKTLAKINSDEAFCHQGYEFQHWSFDKFGSPNERAWLVTKTIEAEDVNSAFAELRTSLFKIVDRIGFVSQCYTTMEIEPYIVVKLDENPEKKFFCYYSGDYGVVGLNFGEPEKQALKALEAYEERGDVFRLLREAGMTPWFYTRFTMLAAALEAMAGEITLPNGFVTTNRKYIAEQILQDAELTDKIFKSRDGVRNQILHGGKIGEEHSGADYIGEIYQAILRYFRDRHNVELNADVIHPMRTPYENYRTWNGWIKPIDQDEPIELQSVYDRLDADFDNRTGVDGRSFYSVFDSLQETPEDY